MKNFLSGAAVALGLSANAAQAVTFDTLSATSFNVVFEWSSTPFNDSNTFSVAYDFDLSFVSYSGTGSDLTGFIFDVNGVRETTSSTACNSSADPLINTGGCDLINALTSPGLLFGNLEGGMGNMYTLGVYDSATPVRGSLIFNVTKVSAVPVPAAGGMLLAALAGFGLIRHRKRN